MRLLCDINMQGRDSFQVVSSLKSEIFYAWYLSIELRRCFGSMVSTSRVFSH